MKEIISFLAPGFTENLINKTTFLASIMFPYLVLISISSFIGALFNANGRFAMWAFSPIILNLGMIIALGISYFYFCYTRINFILGCNNFRYITITSNDFLVS